MLLYIEKKAHTFFELCYHVPKVNKKPIRNCSHTYSSIIELFISRIIVIESAYGLNSLVNTFILVQYCTGFSNWKMSKEIGCRTDMVHFWPSISKANMCKHYLGNWWWYLQCLRRNVWFLSSSIKNVWIKKWQVSFKCITLLTE